MSEVASVNGKIYPAAEACISVLDRSFLFGHGVYETLRTYGGRPFLLDRHLDRLERSARRLAIPLEGWREGLETAIRAALDAGGNPESAIRIVVTRGEGMVDEDPRSCPTPPNLVILVRPLRRVPPEVYRDGTSALVVHVQRNAAEALDPGIKSNNLLNNLLASMEAVRRGFPEAILLNARGDVAEGNSTNVFLVRHGKLLTPSLDSGILDGITRGAVLEVAAAEGIPATEGRIPCDDLRAADEIFLTSTTREILPVVRLDDRPVSSGAPGPVTRRLHDAYRSRTRAFMADGDPG